MHPSSLPNIDRDLNDEITTLGQTLRGQIISLDETGITFETVYGDGTLTLRYETLENVTSQTPYHIIYGENIVVRGWLLGIQDGQLIVGTDPSVAQGVPLKDIIIGIPQKIYEESSLSRARMDFRHWRATLDLGWSLEQGAVEKNKIDISLNVERRKKPTRFVFDVRSAFETQQAGDGPSSTTKNEISSFLLGARDISDRFFLFLQPAGEFDKPRRIDSRFFPSAGVGYRFAEKQQDTLIEFPIGFGFVKEKFEGFGDNSYASLYLGLEGRYNVGKNITLEGKLLYMPGLSDLGNNWLFRARFDVRVPIIDPIALNLRLTNNNDNNPSPEVGNNKFTTTVALSLQFQ